MIAVEEGFCALPAAGAEVNRQDAEGYTALMLAAMHDSSENLQLLLKAGVAPPSQTGGRKNNGGYCRGLEKITQCRPSAHSRRKALIPLRGDKYTIGRCFTLAPAPFVVRVR